MSRASQRLIRMRGGGGVDDQRDGPVGVPRDRRSEPCRRQGRQDSGAVHLPCEREEQAHWSLRQDVARGHLSPCPVDSGRLERGGRGFGPPQRDDERSVLPDARVMTNASPGLPSGKENEICRPV